MSRCSALIEDIKTKNISCYNGFPVLVGACQFGHGEPLCLKETFCGRIFSRTNGLPDGIEPYKKEKTE